MESHHAVIEALGLRAHPEGGWFVETWRADDVPGERPTGSAILYLLAAGERSHWHRVDAAEVWQWSAGEALELRVWADGDRSIAVHRLGADITGGDAAQAVVPAERVAVGSGSRGVGARRLHRDAGVRVRGLRTGAGGLGAAGRLGATRGWSRRPTPGRVAPRGMRGLWPVDGPSSFRPPAR